MDGESDSDDDYFKEIHIVTEEELIRRRRDKIRKLLKLYKSQFKVWFCCCGFSTYTYAIHSDSKTNCEKDTTDI